MNIYTPKFLSNTATDFFNLAYHRCSEIFPVEKGNSDGLLYVRMTAPATNFSFSIELMLKSFLLSIQSDFPKTHSLRALYQALPAACRTQIEANYQGIPIDGKLFPIIRYAPSDYSDDTRPIKLPAKEEIDKELEIHDHSFVNWRYIFSSVNEQAFIEFNFGFAVRFFLACLEYKKTLDEQLMTTPDN